MVAAVLGQVISSSSKQNYLSLRTLHATQSNNYMTSLGKKSITVAAAVIFILLSLITNIIPYWQQPHHLPFTAEAGEGGPCIDYDAAENTIAINCNAFFLDVVETINDPGILKLTHRFLRQTRDQFQEHLSTYEEARVDLFMIQRLHIWDIRISDEEALTFLETDHPMTWR